MRVEKSLVALVTVEARICLYIIGYMVASYDGEEVYAAIGQLSQACSSHQRRCIVIMKGSSSRLSSSKRGRLISES